MIHFYSSNSMVYEVNLCSPEQNVARNANIHNALNSRGYPQLHSAASASLLQPHHGFPPFRRRFGSKWFLEANVVCNGPEDHLLKDEEQNKKLPLEEEG